MGRDITGGEQDIMDVRFLKGTKEQYTALEPKDKYTFYLVGETDGDYDSVYLGELELTSGAVLAQLQAAIGNLEDLTTTEKQTLVGAINELDKEMGDISGMGTTATNVAEAIKELKDAIDALETAEEVSVEKVSPDPEDWAAQYKIMQGGEQKGVTIDIPKDLVVKSAEVKAVTSAEEPDAEGHPVGTYIVLTIANDEGTKVWIDVGKLVDIYTAGDPSSTITVTVDNDQRKITAEVVEHSIGETQLAEDIFTKISRELEAGDADGSLKLTGGTDVEVTGWTELVERVTAVEDELTWQPLDGDKALPTGESAIRPILTQDLGSFGKASDFLDTDVAIAWAGNEGTVTGKIKYHTDTFGFSGDEAKGWYFPVKLSTQYEGKTIKVTTDHDKEEADTDWVICLNKLKEAGKQIKFSCEDKEIATFKFDSVTYNPADGG